MADSINLHKNIFQFKKKKIAPGNHPRGLVVADTRILLSQTTFCKNQTLPASSSAVTAFARIV